MRISICPVRTCEGHRRTDLNGDVGGWGKPQVVTVNTHALRPRNFERSGSFMRVVQLRG